MGEEVGPDGDAHLVRGLHVDHCADVPCMLPFTASVGRYKPLRLTRFDQQLH